MSLLLDDKLVGEVADKCPSQFLQYYECLGKGDAEQCQAEQKQLSGCVTKRSPIFKRIISDCSQQMSAYEQCIRQNTDFRTQCFDYLLDMRKCVAQTVPK